MELANCAMCGMSLVPPGEKKERVEVLLYVEVLGFLISSVCPVKAVQQYSVISPPHASLGSLVKYVSLAEHFRGICSEHPLWGLHRHFWRNFSTILLIERVNCALDHCSVLSPMF